MKLVTAIMPTRGRTEWARQAVACFQAQTYPNKELIVLDDIEEPSFGQGIIVPNTLQFSYLKSSSRSIPIKRNQCCRAASGEIILHWDSDDWYAPERMADQVQRLEESGKQVTGYHSVLFYGESMKEDERLWKYYGSDRYAVGVSLAYTKAFWTRNQFPESIAVGEDNTFGRAALHAQQLISVDGGKMIVARIHDGNTAPKHAQGRQFRKVNRDDYPEAFFQ